MTEFLVFQLFGPLASWGDVAVGERRPSADRPSRSGVLGLCAGALGIRREDEAELAAFHDGYGFACRVDDGATVRIDYHTVQRAEVSLRDGWPQTRRHELGRDRRVGTTLSTRDYLEGAYALACLWARPHAPYTLMAVATALRRPVFTPWLGRKSCPPALPFAPVLKSAADPVAALRDASFEDTPKATGRTFFWDGEFATVGSAASVLRRDQAGRRRPWQFSERLEHRIHEEVPDVP